MFYQSVKSDSFLKYGQHLKDISFHKLCDYVSAKVKIPGDGNEYFASQDFIEQHAAIKEIQNRVYGGMEIQAGTCSGHNTTITAVEFHQGSEVTIAMTDCLLKVGKREDISENVYEESKMETFLLKKGEGVELYGTTLHYSPLKLDETPYSTIICLLKGTNQAIPEKKESLLVKKKNKFMLVSKEREDKIADGYFPGFIRQETF